MNRPAHELLDLLADVFLFERFTRDEIEKVAAFASQFEVKKGEHVFYQGDAALSFYYVVTGAVKIYRVTPAGEEVVVHVHRHGDLAAEAAIFDRKEYPASCMATDDAALVRIDGKEFVNLLLHNPELSIRIMHAYSKRLRGFVGALERLSSMDVKGRLADYLLKQAEPQDGSLICRLTMTKKELASLIGTVPETLSRTLRLFVDKNWIRESEGKTIIIENQSALKKLLRSGV